MTTCDEPHKEGTTGVKSIGCQLTKIKEKAKSEPDTDRWLTKLLRDLANGEVTEQEIIDSSGLAGLLSESELRQFRCSLERIDADEDGKKFLKALRKALHEFGKANHDKALVTELHTGGWEVKSSSGADSETLDLYIPGEFQCSIASTATPT